MAIKKEIGAYSAYAIAKKHGFDGTEEEWLASLVGPRGMQGASITGVKIDSNEHIIVTIHDPATNTDTTIDAGLIDNTSAVQSIQQAAQAAITQVTQAQTAGVNAVNSARDTALQQVQASTEAAQTAATIATEAASVAAGSATAANQSKTDAESAKTAAESSATAAAGSATSAQTHATTAQQAAETATSAAETAADAVSEQLKEDVQGIVDNLDGLSEAIAIKETATGEVISVSDSADYRLQGLKLYGKSVQDGELPPNNQPNDPLPTTPVPIENAGDSGNITTTICGTNLLDFSGAVGGTAAGITATLTGDGGYVMTGTATDTAINIWFFGNYGGEINVFTLYPGTYTCKNVILYGQGSFAAAVNILPNVPYTFTVSQKVVITGVRCVSATTGTTYNETLYPILVRGSSLPEWEPYKSQTFTLSTPNGLRAIPVDSGGDYTDEDGQEWIGDYADLTAKKLVTKIARVDAASFTKNNVISGTGGSRFSFTPPESTMNGSKTLCNYLAYRGVDSYGTAGNYVTTDENKINIRLTEDITLEEFQQKYPDLYVLYQLETPVESNIVGVPDFSGYKPNTTITTDSSPAAGIEVKYVADTKTYIDNKIAAISEAILGGTTNGNV